MFLKLYNFDIIQKITIKTQPERNDHIGIICDLIEILIFDFFLIFD